jgi:hypothetical protein
MSFARTTRTLTNDTFRPSLIGLILAVLVLAGWGLWFALARTPLYATSIGARLNGDGQVTATFDGSHIGRIRRGQEAVVLDGVSGSALRAQVMEVADPYQNRLDPNSVRLFVYSTIPLEQSPSQVRVRVGDESPLITLLRLGANVPGLQTSMKR